MTTTSLHTSKQLLLGEVIRRNAHHAGNRTAFVYEDQQITYQELEVRTTHLAGWIQESGIQIGDKVGIISKNNLEFIEIVFGIALSGAVIVPLNFRLAPKEYVYIINNSDTKILFIEEEYQDMIQSIRNELPKVEKVVVIGKNHTEDMIEYNDIYISDVTYKPIDDEVSDDDDCMICYTSGTTGLPKGAVLSHKNLISNAISTIVEMKLSKAMKQLTITPLFHIAAMQHILLASLVQGTTYIHREFEPMKVLHDIQDYKLENLFMIPSIWIVLLEIPTLSEFDLSSVKKCGTGSALCPVEVKKRLMKYFPNAEFYDVFGQTETSAGTTMLLPEDTIRKTDSVGKPLMNVEVRVVDDNMNDVPIGEIGEIVYRGPNVMKGYYKNEEATAEAFKGGWFHSGDLVKMDEEGFVYVVDRKKDMIISGGENIYPAEIEEVLHKHDAILEAAVIGVPDEKWGENVKAYIVLKEGKQLDEKEVINFCLEYLASYKKPKFVEFIDELPRNASGKILKRVLRDEYVTK